MDPHNLRICIKYVKLSLDYYVITHYLFDCRNRMMRNLVTYENCVALQQTSSHVEELRAKPEYHKFLIGRGGSNIRKVRICTLFHLIVHMINVSLPRSKKNMQQRTIKM